MSKFTEAAFRGINDADYGILVNPYRDVERRRVWLKYWHLRMDDNLRDL